MEYFATIGGKWKSASMMVSQTLPADRLQKFDKKLILYEKWSNALDRISSASAEDIAKDGVLLEWCNYFSSDYAMVPSDIRARISQLSGKLGGVVQLYNETHKIKNAEYDRRYRAEHAAEISARKKQWRASHKSVSHVPHQRELFACYRTGGKARLNAKRRQHYQAHKSEILERRKKLRIEKKSSQPLTQAYVLSHLLCFQNIDSNTNVTNGT